MQVTLEGNVTERGVQGGSGVLGSGPDMPDIGFIDEVNVGRNG